MQFIDRVEILVKAGNGGDGVVAWLREAHLEFGGPAGGDGGNGGSVILVGDHNLNTLFNFRYTKKILAENGENGQIKNMYGRSAKDIEVKVPLGTVIKDKLTNEVLVDIVKEGQKYIICQGGNGGRGNAKFLSSENKAPRLYERGDLGEEREIILELKVLADVGIIGMPNAGKSTLLSKVSAARPKVANYPFTTLTPVLGVVNLKGNRVFVMADIPGLIEGASSGSGLGFDFLKHIERCKCLMHLVSMDPNDNEEPYEIYLKINKELQLYGNHLLDKPMLIVATKLDADGATENLKKFVKKVKLPIIEISALENKNLDKLLEAAYKTYLDNKEIVSLEENLTDSKTKLYRFNPDNKPGSTLKIQKTENGWEVTSNRLKYWVHKIPLTTPDNIIRFNQKMESEGVFTNLAKMGAQRKDTINVYGQQFEYED